MKQSPPIFEIIGYTGGIILASNAWPQIYKIYEKRSADDLSYHALFLYLTGISMLMIYNIHIDKPALYLPGTVETINVLLLITMKYLYTRQASSTQSLSHTTYGSIL
tara:strand:+ start:228 stop:548 length:321 start_codon:yes stop_codon:yes gene_type:complete